MRSFPRSSFTFTLLAAGLLFTTASVASAGEHCLGKRGAKMEKRVVEKLGPSLGLDEAKSQELAAILKESRVARMEAMKTVRAERDTLKQLLENKASGNELDAQRANVEAAMVNVPSKLDVLASTGRILDAEQQAMLTLKLSGHGHGKKGKMRKRGGRKGEGRRGPKAE